MNNGKYPRSVAKHIRTEKALIRRATQNPQEQEKLIKDLLHKFEANVRT